MLVQLYLTVASWTLAHQAPLSMEFSRQEYWSGLPFPTPGDLPDPGMESSSLVSPARAGGFFTTAPPRELDKCEFKVCLFLLSMEASLLTLAKPQSPHFQINHDSEIL